MKRAIHVGMFRAGAIALAAGLLAGPATAGQNLVTNFDHREKNGVGLAVGWTKHIRDKMFTTLNVAPQPDGALRFDVTGEPFSFYEQRNLTLVPGAKYRLSYEVKTEGLEGNRCYVFLRDSKWSWDAAQQAPFFPDDTRGEWVRQEFGWGQTPIRMLKSNLF